MDIHFIKSDSGPGGLGEPGTAVVQPAIGNAIFAACGKRCRNLPFTPENIGRA
jgi:isoquinoline 1-oxidoreductase beta subunit